MPDKAGTRKMQSRQDFGTMTKGPMMSYCPTRSIEKLPAGGFATLRGWWGVWRADSFDDVNMFLARSCSG